MAIYELVKPEIRSIAPYVPGKSVAEIAEKYNLEPDSIIKLGSNENPLGPSPAAVRALQEAAGNVNIYPSADARELVDAISAYVGMPQANIVASGPGMDGLLDGLMRMLISADSEVVITTPTFSYYEIAATACGAQPVFVKRNEKFDVDIDRVIAAVNENTKVVFICSPNNPTGNITAEKELRRLLDSVECLVFVDEAYVEFADSDIVSLVGEYDNLVVGRTFSKAFGLAGLRLGYGIMPAWLKVEYMKAATPFNVSAPAVAAGIAALSDKKHREASQQMVIDGRDYLKVNMPFNVYESQANFMLVDVAPHGAKDVCDHLLRRGVIVRDCTSFRDAGDSFIRVTVGTREQNERVVEGFSTYL
ncbi:histidinol-phosphate transaminase [Methanohalophilus euhalobius]|uniref:Histidinol-phosphate aminotransferase n=1 Tax=Methanohalophilus euhalobius TaxID=51203 RepID=A0A315A069_9EURY|nr:histidinol-phosphate transaminase [Methanohalophilus euhalobius]PQV42751.1 histidinol phosphate aminotransferase [Methanohalophilus euhalobius]RNI10563.1 histidinol-phosphate transaminase [Methanohalophilus euhalobius]